MVFLTKIAVPRHIVFGCDAVAVRRGGEEALGGFAKSCVLETHAESWIPSHGGRDPKYVPRARHF